MLKKVILAGLLVVSGANAGMFDSVVSADALIIIGNFPLLAYEYPTNY